ncbi:TPA: DUF2264 domain-containing protein [Kluyvera ascorbata]|uniref:DUF2264 domain-containing protein n=1 Tax=Kluyvera genomosp. 2 TaxID=2774054 RepID=A0A2T2Y8E3_9ENTR|nr:MULTISPECIES: DUF2264 domain-containing protein [Enterobacteriaceae]HAT3916467.1 DUF2264 domain-containing protein [Kluyvera ascorbata]PSR48813.1 hypothetical protein C8256_02150 [Kluyvera genomosp. 2]BBQ83108.1 hypothetical protein WP3W18E02_16370 [Klebsiella sp. WP3-W18-ESBL-02]BBR20203.1 hypothetical protein WP3S18E05_16830 [Klebsiella sp. WP3-S18-ESBL-05]HAT3941380.1 DUF2264 domain-containing protein [Kluyvera ascorbata]
MRTKQEYSALLQGWIAAAVPHLSADCTRLHAGDTAAQYPDTVAGMEGVIRLLWGAFPLVSGGTTPPWYAQLVTGVRHGCDPQHPGYWGDVGDNDQRCVEMAAFGLGLALPDSGLWQALSATEQDNLVRWLSQSAEVAVPDNNWHFFPVLIQLGLKCVGRGYDMAVINRHLDAIEPFWLGNGWYCDGHGKPRDYYISSAFHFYGLIYSHFMQDVDPERCLRYRQRAQRFAQDYRYYFTTDGAAIPFGRSLTYRFVQVAFWSAVAFTELDVFTPGVVKGLILRHLDYWQTQPFIGADGLFSIGYAYPNLIMAEDYNSPGSPYWALKAMLILALPEESRFWRAECEPMPALDVHHPIPEAGQIVVHSDGGRHAWMLMSGQFDKNNFVNFEQKYSKFAYSSHFGFTLERGRYGLNHAAVDSMLLFSAGDDYYRGRRACDSAEVTGDWVRSEWRPWPDVIVTSWLMAQENGHIRVHRIMTPRNLQCVEGGFAVNHHHLRSRLCYGDAVTLETRYDYSRLVNLCGNRRASTVTTPPNSNLLFAAPADIPCLTTQLEAGTGWLACYVSADPGAVRPMPDDLTFDLATSQLTVNGKTLTLK